jgi:hypothetical protein
MVSFFKDSRTVANIDHLVKAMIEKRSLKLWTLATDKAEFERHHRLLDGSLKTVVDESVVRDCLTSTALDSVGDNGFVVALHDPCDIRKPYAKEMEHIGKVRALNGDIVNGYCTFDTVICDGDGKKLRPMDITTYSNGDPAYVTQEEIKNFDKVDWEGWDDEKRSDLVEKLMASGDYHNLETIRKDQLSRVSQALKASNPGRKIRHILDRQNDDDCFFIWIDDDLEDEFVIRMKLSRNSTVSVKNPKTGRDVAIKLKDVDFSHGDAYGFSKLKIKGKIYQNVRCVVEWEEYPIKDHVFTVVRVTLLDRKGEMIFGEPMLLITNVSVKSLAQAYAIYRHYLLRAKIEGVFKFLKDLLGWEEFQIRDFAPIKNLLALGFYVAGYFYEIDSDLIREDIAQWLAELGGVKKGKVTRFFILKGLSKLLTHMAVEQFVCDKSLNRKQIKKLFAVIE